MRRRAGFALGCSAAAGLIYEVTITNILFYYFVESSYSVATVISVFLFGLGIGSYSIHLLRERIQRPAAMLAIVQLTLAAYAFTILSRTEPILASISTVGIIGVSVLLLLLPTMLLGATFALAGQLIEHRGVGLVYAIDLGGAVLGTIIAGFWLIPAIGNTATLLVAACLNIAAGILAIERKRTALIAAALLIAAVAGVALSMPEREQPQSRTVTFDTTQVMFFNDTQRNISMPSPYGLVELRGNRLYIDKHDECTLDFEQDEIRIVNMTLAQFDKDVRVANVGLGCGKTAAAIIEGTSTSVDIIEINPAVIELNSELSNLLEHERAHIIRDEGYQFFRHTNNTYDAIIIDIENPAVMHASNIYTKEAFREMKHKLSRDGVLALWSYPCPSDKYNAILANTLASQFRYVYHPTPEIFLSSSRPLPFDEFPRSPTEENTLDKKVLSRVYFDECGFWFSPQNSTHIMFK